MNLLLPDSSSDQLTVSDFISSQQQYEQLDSTRRNLLQLYSMFGAMMAPVAYARSGDLRSAAESMRTNMQLADPLLYSGYMTVNDVHPAESRFTHAAMHVKDLQFGERPDHDPRPVTVSELAVYQTMLAGTVLRILRPIINTPSPFDRFMSGAKVDTYSLPNGAASLFSTAFDLANMSIGLVEPDDTKLGQIGVMRQRNLRAIAQVAHMIRESEGTGPATLQYSYAEPFMQATVGMEQVFNCASGLKTLRTVPLGRTSATPLDADTIIYTKVADGELLMLAGS